MGLIKNKKILTRESKIFDFLFFQSCWGHKKRYLKCSLHKNVLGFKNNFVVFNNEHFLESLHRSSLFCFNLVNSSGDMLFVSSNDNYKRLIAYFGSRSSQRFYVDKWLGGLITNNLLINYLPSVLVLSNLKHDAYASKEALIQLIPVICLEDSDHSFNKSLYSILANDDEKNSVFLFCCFLTNSIIKSFLVRHSIDLLN